MDLGIHLLVIQVTSEYNKDELTNLSEKPVCRNLNYVPAYSDLTNLMQVMKDKICDSKFVPIFVRDKKRIWFFNSHIVAFLCWSDQRKLLFLLATAPVAYKSSIQYTEKIPADGNQHCTFPVTEGGATINVSRALFPVLRPFSLCCK